MPKDIARLSDEVEQVSQIYAGHYGLDRDDAWFLLKLQEEVGELTQAFLAMSGRSRKRGRSDQELRAQFGQELADVFCHVLLLARAQGVDLDAEVEAKWLSRLRPR